MKKKHDEYQTIRIWVKTQRRLKILSALLGKSMIEVLDDLVEEKLKAVKEQETS
jgi:predicted DNA-binding protein